MKDRCIRPDINEKLLLYLDDLVQGAEQSETSLHIQQCTVCAEEIKKLKAIKGALIEHRELFSTLKPPGTCLLPQDLIDYRDRRPYLSIPAIEAVEKHLSTCLTCSREYEFLSQLHKELQIPPRTQQVISEEAEFLAAVAREYPLKVPAPQQVPGAAAINRLRGALAEFREWTSDLFAPQAQLVFVRKALRRFQGNISSIKRRLSGIELKIEIEARDEKTADVIIFISPVSRKETTTGLRAMLCQQGKEIRVVSAEKGKVFFKRIAQGEYELILLRQGKEVLRTQFKTRKTK